MFRSSQPNVSDIGDPLHVRPVPFQYAERVLVLLYL